MDAAHEIEAALREGDVAELPALSQALLERVAGEPGRWAAVHHPLGFVNIDIKRTSTRALLIHLWNAPTTGAVTIHRHSWSFRSFVLVGTLRNRTYRVHPANGRPTHRVYEVGYDAGEEVLTAESGGVTPESTEERILRAGALLEVPALPFHSIEATAAPAATILTAEYRPESATKILAPIGRPECFRNRRARCSAERLRSLITQVLDSLPAPVD